jgi:hypothetical protein
MVALVVALMVALVVALVVALMVALMVALVVALVVDLVVGLSPLIDRLALGFVAKPSLSRHPLLEGVILARLRVAVLPGIVVY